MTENALTTIRAGGQVQAIVATSIEDAVTMGRGVAAAGLAPRTLETADKCTVAILTGAELGLKPMQALKCFAMINNRLTLYGDGIPALLLSNGFKLREWAEGEPFADDYTARCEVTRPDGDVIPGEFSVADAKKAKLWTKAGPWQDYPKRMLLMRARAFAARDGAADILAGMPIAEEVEDFSAAPDRAAPQKVDLRARLTGGGEEGFSQEHVETHLGGASGDDTLPAGSGETAADEPQDAEVSDISPEADAIARNSGGGGTCDAADAAGIVEPATDDLMDVLAVDTGAIDEAAEDIASLTGEAADEPSASEPEPESLIAQATTNDPNDPIQAFWHKINARESWAGYKGDLGALVKTEWWSEHPDLQNVIRASLWDRAVRDLIQTGRDRVDHAADPTAFRCWIETQEGPEGGLAIRGTLRVLQREERYKKLPKPSQEQLDNVAEERAKALIGEE